jgi:peroxiredoxin
MDLEFDVVDLGSADHPEAGERAPDFERPLVDGEYWEDTSLSELTDEGPVALVFHPMDGAFPATYVWSELRDHGWVPAAGADNDAPAVEVVGLSISTPYEHKEFIADRGIDARLFSDPGNGVAEQYGIDHDLDGMAGVSEPRPAAFVVDDERAIQYAWVADQWPQFLDYDELGAAIDGVT